MVDDWCKILGLAEAPSDPEEFLAVFAAGPTAASLLRLRPRIEVAFFCIDRVRWEFYTDEGALLSSVREGLAARRDLVIREMALAETIA
jgi:hypothetical protein